MRTPKVIRRRLPGRRRVLRRVWRIAATDRRAELCAAKRWYLTRVDRSKSWMDAGLKNQDLLYVTNQNGLVNVYRYSQHTLVGVLTDFEQPMGECIDASGHVYITDYQADEIAEYAHGVKKPIYIIKDSDGPYGCAVDPRTGNLAVANFGPLYKNGNFEVYVHARGKPIIYGQTCGETNFMSVGYDKYGNLLAEASYYYSIEYNGGFSYLPAKSKTPSCIQMPGPSSSWNWYQVFSIVWDGKYWVIDTSGLYRYTINIKAEYIDKIVLSGAGYVGPIAIYRKSLKGYGTQIVGTSGYLYGGTLEVLRTWNYPSPAAPGISNNITGSRRAVWRRD